MKPLFQALTPAGRRARLSTLIFHRVLPVADPLFPHEMDAARFDRVCGWLARWFRVMRLDDATRALANGTLPARALAITFDDGYADNHHTAQPILARHGLTATFFIATGFLDGGAMWNDRVAEAFRDTALTALDAGACGVPGFERLPLATPQERRQAIDAVLSAIKYLPIAERLAVVDRLVAKAGADAPRTLMMRTDQVQALHRAGGTIGAHTVNHPILARLSDTDALAEITTGKVALESMLQTRVGLFAYPNGRPDRDYTARTVRLVAQVGFDAAVTTAQGVAAARDDLFQLPRFTPWDATPGRFGLRLGANLFKPPTCAA